MTESDFIIMVWLLVCTVAVLIQIETSAHRHADRVIAALKPPERKRPYD